LGAHHLGDDRLALRRHPEAARAELFQDVGSIGLHASESSSDLQVQRLVGR